jgi:hypothetical protein
MSFQIKLGSSRFPLPLPHSPMFDSENSNHAVCDRRGPHKPLSIHIQAVTTSHWVWAELKICF